jgi:threonine aldolase
MKFKDTECGCHPAVTAEISRASSSGFFSGHDTNDNSIKRAREILAKKFGAKAVFFTAGTTLANLVLMKQYLKEGGCVVTAHSSHLLTNDGSAPAFFLECPILPVQVGNDGKLTVKLLTLAFESMTGAGAPYQPIPEIVSITQPTESGHVYSLEELIELSKFCRERGIRLHMDGARLSLAAAALNLPFATFTKDIGVSMLSLGARKSIGGFGTAILFFENVDQAMVLRRMVKFRAILEDTWRIAASFIALFERDAAIDLATVANLKAKQLSEQLTSLDLCDTYSGTNAAWIKCTELQHQSFRDGGVRYSANFHQLGDRLTTSWDTTDQEISSVCEVIVNQQHQRGLLEDQKNNNSSHTLLNSSDH